MSYGDRAAGQGSLFTQPDNLSAGSPVEQSSPAGSSQHQGAETEFLEEAYEYAVKRISTHQDSAFEFISVLVKQFGYGIRMYVLEIAQRLIKDSRLIGIQREYTDTSFNASELLAVLQEKPHRNKQPDSMLDELFSKSVGHRHSDKFIEAVNFVARLREYAPYNNMLVYVQRPNATFWATQADWRRRFKRSIKEDAIPIIMLQPMGPVMLVYEVADTVGPPLPARYEDAFNVEGDFEQSWLDKTEKNCKQAGIRVMYKSLGKLHAGSAIRSSLSKNARLTIELNKALEASSRYATLCHELGHIHLGHLGGHPKGYWPSRLGLKRSQQELEAEAVAHLVCSRAGLKTTSAEYLAGYLANPDDLKGISVDMIMKVSGYIERMARKEVRPRRKKPT